MSSGVVVSMMYNIKIASDWPISMMDGIEPNDMWRFVFENPSKGGLKREHQGKKTTMILPPSST